MTPSAAGSGGLTTPSLRRRLAAFVYEGVLLFGVVMVPGLIYAVLTRQTHALTGTRGLQWSVFLVVGAYFIFCWSRSGQTLAMQTWRVRLVDQAGGRVSAWRATLRSSVDIRPASTESKNWSASSWRRFMTVSNARPNGVFGVVASA